jgi:hypothetical protein
MKTKETSKYPEETYGFASELSTREQAIVWWNNLPVWGNPSKNYYMGLYYSDDTVTAERIEKIWRKETQEQQYSIYDSSMKNTEDCGKITVRESKPNQKQFKQFDESLFRAYVDKFSNEDKLQALTILACEISTTNVNLNNLLNRISSYQKLK